MARLDGKTVLVTGAGAGIGAAVAKRLAADGARVMVTDIAGERAREVADAIGASAQWMAVDHCDYSQCLEAVQRTVRSFGGLDVLHNNAGVPQQGGVEDIAPEEFRRVVEANLTGPFLMTRAAIPALRERAATGANVSILFTASIQSLMVRAGFTAYAASKHGVGGLVGSMALEFAPVPIRVNAVCPGPADTALLRDIARRTGDEEGFLARFKAGMPMQRLVRTEDVAAAAAFLSSDDAAMITGVMLPVDGGMTAR
jgi:NAD(P)-dependent dehydrogenase (short-subunit alcohol dehydrogenase family)